MRNIFRTQAGNNISRSKFGTYMIVFILLFLSIFMMFPLLYAIMQSLKPANEIFAFPPKLFVRNPSLDNYRNLFRLTNSLWVPFSRYVFNSFFVTLAGTAVYILIASMAAYALSYGKFRGIKAINDIVVKALLFSSPVTAIAQYLIIVNLRMLNTYWALLLPALSAPLGVFLMKQFVVQMIPTALIEASRVDGASEFRILFQIVMPIVKPAIMTLILFTSQSLWNTTGNIFIYDEAYKVLPTVMNELIASGISRQGEGSAAIILLMLPPIIVFFFTQSNVIETMAASGIKE